MTPLVQVPSKAKPFTHLSYSSISTYQSCPLRWHFKYILGLPVTTISASLVFGSALHACVQYHFEQLLVGRPTTDLEALLSVYQDSWESFTDRSILFPKGEDARTLGRMAERLLASFLRSDFAQPKGVILGVEEELRGVVVPGCPDLLGRIDLIVDGGNELAVSDFKTSRSWWSGEKVGDAHRSSPPSIGTMITFRYQELTEAGVPRFPTFVRVRGDALPTGGEPTLSTKTASTRRFEFVEGASNKFWEISQTGSQVTVCFGRNGTSGQRETKTFADAEAAQKHADKKIAEKLKKGYSEVGQAA